MSEWFFGLPEEDGVYWTLPADKSGEPELVDFRRATYVSKMYPDRYGTEYWFGSEESYHIKTGSAYWWRKTEAPVKP